MFTKHADQEVDIFIILHWLLMSLCAGFLNAFAFLGLGTFASHVTGFATLFGVSIASSRPGSAVAALAVPLFFLGGTIVSGLAVEARVRRNEVPHYDYVMYGCAGLLVMGALVGSFRDADPQTYLHLEKNFVLLSLVSLASGLMNAALSYSSGATVRITHLTGITTDLGRGIAESISLRARHVPLPKTELRMNLVRALTIGAFALGGIIGAYFYRAFFFAALLFPAAYFAYAGHHGRKLKKSVLAMEWRKTAERSP